MALIPACAQTKAVGDAALAKRQADAEYDASQAQLSAEAQAAWDEGKALYDGWMAAAAPDPAPSDFAAVEAWFNEKNERMYEVDDLFFKVYSADLEQGYETQLLIGDMWAKVAEDLVSFEPGLTSSDNVKMHNVLVSLAVGNAIEHYDHFATTIAEGDAKPEDYWPERIADGESRRDEMKPKLERSKQIVAGELKVGSDAAAE